MKQLVPLALLVIGLQAPLFAENWATPATSHSEQNWFGPPYIAFGRKAAGSDLPGYSVATGLFTHDFDSDFDSLPGEMNMSSLSLWAPIAPINRGDLHVITFLGYRATQFDTSIDNMLSDDTLHTFRLPVLFLKDVSQEWIWGGMVMPGFSGELSNSDNFSISGAIGAGRAFSPNFKLLAGVYYFNGFGEDYIIPGAVFTWRPTPKWEAYFFGPIGGVSYSINECWMASLIGEYDSATWHVDADDEYQARDTYYRTIRAGLKIEGRLSNYLWAYATAGYSFAKRLEIEDTDNNSLQKDDVNGGAFVRVGLNVRF